MPEKFSRYDTSDYLQTEEEMALYLDACLDEDLGDGSLIRTALGKKGMNQLADDIGISRESLDRTLAADGQPEFSTVMRWIRALGVRLHADLARLSAGLARPNPTSETYRFSTAVPHATQERQTRKFPRQGTSEP